MSIKLSSTRKGFQPVFYGVFIFFRCFNIFTFSHVFFVILSCFSIFLNLSMLLEVFQYRLIIFIYSRYGDIFNYFNIFRSVGKFHILRLFKL